MQNILRLSESHQYITKFSFIRMNKISVIPDDIVKCSKPLAMKYALSVIFILSLLTGCSSPKKLLQKGNYDALIEKSVKSLIKDPGSEKDAAMLDKAYGLANERDLERIKYLKVESNPDTWDEMLGLYAGLKNRQASVRRVLPMQLGGRTINYEQVDYDHEIAGAKRKAADYFNAHGRKLMGNNTRESYRQAYYELIKAQDYSGDSYPDLDPLITRCRSLGTSHVLIEVINRSIINLPTDFTDGLVAVDASGLNSEWVEFHTRKPDNNVQFDYYIDIMLQAVDVSPDQVQEKDEIQKKTIENGFDYVLDARGNVKKDSAGNDIKVKKYKDIQCTVIESHQMKDCQITGEIEFHAGNPESLLKKQPIAAGTHFEHISARAIGDVNALSPEKKKLIELKRIPFPNDIQMILDSSEALKKAIREAIQNNRGLIR